MGHTGAIRYVCTNKHTHRVFQWERLTTSHAQKARDVGQSLFILKYQNKMAVADMFNGNG